MKDLISDLYHGELHPNEHDYAGNTRAATLMESYKKKEAWLTEHLDGKEKIHMMELINVCDELDGLMSFEAFRDGFILGAGLIMEVCCSVKEARDD